jgi:hypothetical protein
MSHTNILKSTLTALAASAALVTLAIPAAAQPAAPPSYAVQGEEQIQGTIRSIDGKYAISVRDRRGFVDNVALHDGTVINPTGLRLAPGQRVTIFVRGERDRHAVPDRARARVSLLSLRLLPVRPPVRIRASVRFPRVVR